jgi:MFS family permease
LFLRSPEAVPADGAEAQAKPSPSYGVSLKAALLTPQPWLIIGAVLLNAGSTLAISFHLFTLLRDRHVSATLATAVQSMLPVFSVSGYMISGFLMDRVNRPQIAIPFFLTATAGAAAVAFASSTPILVLGVAMLGFGAGGDGPVLGYFVARFFGLRAWGQIVALLAAIGSACATGGPLLMALSYDRTGSYHIGLLGAVGAFVLATILVSLVGPYTYTATGEPAEPRVRARKSPTICPTAAP